MSTALISAKETRLTQDLKLNHTSARHWISTNPFAVLKGLSKLPLAAELRQAHSFWMNRETRRRLLVGSFILDTQLTALFEQQAVLFPHWPSETVLAHTSNLPCPCDNELWECSNVEEWAELAASCRQVNLSAATDPATYDNPSSLDPFRSRLTLAYLATYPSPSGSESDVGLAAFCENLAKRDPSGLYTRTEFDMHAHSAAKHTPIRSLLIVSGESWLFGKKLENEDDFQIAKSRLREWVSSSKAHAALWHATALLRTAFRLGSDTPVESSFDIGTPDESLGMLHEEWCIYLAALICWACAFDETTLTQSRSPTLLASSSMMLSPMLSETRSPNIAAAASSVPTGYPPLMDPRDAAAEMRHLLHTTDVEDVSDLPAALAMVRGQTRGLLEVVRTRKINGVLGGLLNEASGVLYRLVEGRSGLSRF